MVSFVAALLTANGEINHEKENTLYCS